VSLLIERDGGVVRLVLNRPDKLNAVDDDTWLALRAACAEIADRPDDRVVVLAGAGRAFCSGTDVTTLLDGEEHFMVRMRRVADALVALHRLPQPTVARVHGAAVGVGCSLALACDLVLAAESARFCEIFSRRGLSIDGGASWLLPRLVGPQKAKELAFFGDMVDARDALAIGLVNRVVPDDELDPTVADWVGRLRAGPPLALSMTKRLLDASFERTFAAALDAEASCQVVNVGTEDAARAMEALAEGRSPEFVGR
jgi:2-(1,2-epoxy-1,2-dihydrophenyl)acetyl-CoA isomerase